MEASIEVNETEYFHKPSLVLRVKSTILDSIILIILMFIVFAVLNQFSIESTTVKRICMLFIILYEPITVTLGGTVGQRVMGLRVSDFSNYVNQKSHKNINLINSILRFIAKVFLGWISLLTIHSDDYGKAIHDSIGKSLMTFRI